MAANTKQVGSIAVTLNAIRENINRLLGIVEENAMEIS